MYSSSLSDSWNTGLHKQAKLNEAGKGRDLNVPYRGGRISSESSVVFSVLSCDVLVLVLVLLVEGAVCSSFSSFVSRL